MVCESETRTSQAFAVRRFHVEWLALRLRLPLVLRGTCALLSIPRSRLERECRSPLEPFWRVRNFSFCDGDVCSATCSDALRLRRGLTQAYVNLQAILSIDTLPTCAQCNGGTQCVSCKSNAERKMQSARNGLITSHNRAS